jgi:UTP--glucose-1-phosphate uridylyltransferase
MSPLINKAVITAAGFGSRFLPITKTFPKELLPIVDKPIIQYLVQECADAGIEEVIIVASPTEVAKFEDYFYGRATSIRTLMIRQGKLDRWDKVEKVFQLPKITIVPQDEGLPYGNGRPFLTVKDLISDGPFVAMWGDDLVLSEKSAVQQLVEEYENKPCDGLLAVQEVPDSEVDRYGIIKIKEGTDDHVETVIEKPSLENAPSNLASYGRYILTPKIFDYLSPESTGLDGEIWLQDANDRVAKNGVVRYKVIDGEWMTTGDPIRYMKAHIKFMLAHKKYGAELAEFIDEMD